MVETTKRLIDEPTIITELNNILLFGNDQLFIDTFIEIVILKFYEADRISYHIQDNYKVSEYHFEYDFSTEHYIDHINHIKQLMKLKTMNNKPHIVHIKRLPKNRCKFVHYLLEGNKGNMIFFISAPSLSPIDDAIKSRCLLLKMVFPLEKCLSYCSEFNVISEEKTHDFNKIYSSLGGNIISILIYYENIQNNMNLRYEEALKKTLDVIEKTKSFLVAITTIREFIYKIFHLNIPFNEICKKVIQIYGESLSRYKMQKLCELSACLEHKLSTTYKDIFIYEKYFIEVGSILKEKDVKEVPVKSIDINKPVIKRGRKPKTESDIVIKLDKETQQPIKRGRKKATT